MRTWVTWLVLCYLVIQTRAQCPTGCSCIGSTELVCIGAGLTEVPDFSASIRQTTTDLDLGSNLITSIRATDFQGFTDLERLGFSSNRISSIEEGSFSSNTALGSLNLADNELREIPDSLFEFTPLSSLDLNGNLIGNVSALTFIGVQPGASVQIEDNAIRTIPEDTFDGVQNLRGLGLSGNPLRCDCGLRWLPSFINSSIIGAGSSAIGTCDVPAHLNGVSLRQLTEDQFLCNCTLLCVNGSCDLTVGECECDDGYVGGICDSVCPSGTFGAECAELCTCVAGRVSSPCDSVNGACHCLPGFTGQDCEEKVSYDFTTEVPSNITGTTTDFESTEDILPVYGKVLLIFGSTLILLTIFICVAVTITLKCGKSQRNLRKIEPHLLQYNDKKTDLNFESSFTST